MTALSAHDLTAGYGSRIVNHRVNAVLEAGELACLVGPNGAGKSTLLATLAGMQKPLSGWVQLGADNIHKLPVLELAKRLSVVLTERVNVGNLSAFTLVSLGRHPHTDWRGVLAEHDQAIVRRALAQTGALHLADRSVNELSDGERQRIMIARALAQEPQALLLDEPTAFLDLPRRVELMHLLSTLARERHMAILLSTHDLDLALRVADRLWIMSANGQLTAGLPEELALNGTLADTFRSEGVEFDSRAGAFKILRHPCGPIALIGNGLAAQWTARALERVGYDVVRQETNNLTKLIQVNVTDSGWRVSGPNLEAEFTSLAALITKVKHL